MRKEQLASFRHQMVSDNLAEFGNTAGVLNWVSPARAMAAEDRACPATRSHRSTPDHGV